MRLIWTQPRFFSLFHHYLRISRVLDCVKRLLYILTLIVTPLAASAQRDTTVAGIGFSDSVRFALENTRNLDAQIVGGGFTVAWGNLGLDQQIRIRRQTNLMKRKGYKLRPHLIQYFGALVAAVNIEAIDPVQFNNFLKVVDKVILNYRPDKAINFFKTSRDFFKNHALFSDKGYRLYARESDYVFEYIEFIPPPVDTVASLNETVTDTWAEEPVDTVYHEPPPFWETPAPQPTIEGAAIRFNRTDLNFVTPYDSVFLRNTKGVYSLMTNIFVGEDGRFDWSSALLHSDSVYCNFTVYNFNAKKLELKVDLVKLNYVGKTPGFIPGKFEFYSQPRRDSVASSYPRFTSYESTLNIKGLGSENLKYTGGFSLRGPKILSSSVGGEMATIEVADSVATRFKARSKEFVFLDSAVTSSHSYFTLYQGNDSITHRSVQMRFDYPTQKLVLTGEKGPMKNAPYSSSFFNLDFSASVIRWDLKADSLDISSPPGSIVPVLFESVDYYKPEDFHTLGGIGFNFHPLAMVAIYCIQNNTRELHTGDLAQRFGYNILEIQKAIEFLAQKGLVEYWPMGDLVKVKEKAITQYRAEKGEKDYDNLKIQSVTGSYAVMDLKKPFHPNATLSFKRRNMVVRGVEEFNVSDSLNVMIRPDSALITILQNRDIKFNGTVTAGNFEITGKDFTLKYDSFFISLNHIDSINFYVMERNTRGQMVRRKINNSMVGADSVAAAQGGMANAAKVSGTLYINRPNNKAGKIKVPDFPRLDAAAGGVIYFNRPEVLGGVYDESIFFVVPPFKLDSLNDADPASLNFDGTFVSSGMFPSFKDKLHTMPDKSLGFVHATPPGGYQLYKGDGKLEGVITMDNRGIRAPGKIDFLAANVRSNDFLFYPDSVIAKGAHASISEKQFGSVVFPQASLPDYQMKWFPKQDQMKFRNTTSPFNFYDSSAQLTGTITVSKKGVSGIGKLETRGSELRSREMSFSAKDFGARHARFKAKSDDPTKPLIDGTDVRVKFNLEKNYADISPEIEGQAAIEFPFAQFKTSIPNARWDLTNHKITMSKNPDVPIENSYFYTTRKELDSLSFYAEKAVYDLNTKELKVSGIPYIVVADAKITPENNEVLILENAKIGTLKNTTIVLDTLNGYHRLTEGVVDVISRKQFSGYATYQYVNLLQDTFAIKMTDFHLEDIVPDEKAKKSQRRKSIATQQTVGVGTVAETEKLVLGAGMFYKGDLTMYATKPALKLTGFVKLDIKKLKDYHTWIRYSQSGDETEVLIDFDNAITEEGRKVDAGLHFSSLENNLYISFLNEKNEGDDDFFIPSGTLYYDTLTKEYKIEDREKAAGNKLSGKVFAYNDDTQAVRFEGPVSLLSGTKDFSITATALGQGNMETNEIRMNSLVMVNTNIVSDAFNIMAKNIQAVIQNEGAEEGLGDHTELLYKLADIIGERNVKDYEAKSQQGYVSLGTIAETARPLNFANVNLKWHPKLKAFYSEGKLGLSNISKNDINGAFEGFMEIKKNAEDGSAVFNVFFKASPDSWFYFGYEDNRLLMYSSVPEFNTIVSKKTNSGKAKVGEMVFIPGSEEETTAFINRFRKEYYEIEVPYDLSSGTTPVKKTEKEEKKKEEKDDGF